MQERHSNANLYFNELAATSRKYFIPYIQDWAALKAGMNVLEIGCGVGGNLLPFSEMGCNVTGVDMAENKIRKAVSIFEEAHAQGKFIASDIFAMKDLERSFDLILCHDVIEHIPTKELFLSDIEKYLKPGGVVFMSFPAWQMPFGGHQQICKSGVLSHFPFIHLLPKSLYKFILKHCGEDSADIEELLSIKSTATTIELFERLVSRTNLKIINRRLYFINPHYEIKFGLKPRKLSPLIDKIPYVRDFFTTSCFYLLI